MKEKQLEQKQRELTKLADKIRAKGYSLQTERSYIPAVSNYIDFICEQSWRLEATTEEKVEVFLTKVARDGAAASTQNAKFHAILFYYREVRKTPLRDVDALRAKTGDHKRQSPTREDTRKIMMAVADAGAYPTRLICHLLYACGLRVSETLAIRLKDLDLDAGRLVSLVAMSAVNRTPSDADRQSPRRHGGYHTALSTPCLGNARPRRWCPHARSARDSGSQRHRDHRPLRPPRSGTGAEPVRITGDRGVAAFTFYLSLSTARSAPSHVQHHSLP